MQSYIEAIILGGVSSLLASGSFWLFVSKYRFGRPVVMGAIAIGISISFMWLHYQTVLVLGTKNRIIIYNILSVCFALAAGCVFAFAYATRHWSINKRLSQHIEDFIKKISGAPLGAKIVLAQSANSLLHNLTNNVPLRPPGEDLRLDEYIDILKESHEHGAPNDVTLFMTGTSTDWYKNGTVSEKELRSRVENYFNNQSEVKRKAGENIRIRRIVLWDTTTYNSITGMPPTSAEKQNYDRFIKEHKDADIDLIWCEKNKLTTRQRNLAKDMAIFLSENGTGWVIQSDLVAATIAQGKVNAYLDYSGDNAACFDSLKKELLGTVLKVYSNNSTTRTSSCCVDLNVDHKNPPRRELLANQRIAVPDSLFVLTK